MHRTEDFRRQQRDKYIKKRKRDMPTWYVKHDGELSKNKNFCSCPMCQFDTRRPDAFELEKELENY